jgi:hypothetical protein
MLAFAALLLTVALAGVALTLSGGRALSVFAPHGNATAGTTKTATAPPPSPIVAAPSPPVQRTSQPGVWSLATGARIAAADSIVAIAGLIALASLIVKNRLDARERRDYRLYEVHLSMHDDAKPRDLHDMVEALAAAVREWPLDRARYGQPYFAIELHYGQGRDGMEFLICLRCERELAVTLQSVLANAYPDVRVGQIHGGDPVPLPGRLREPGYVLRFRKERPFIYPLAAREEEEASPTMEAIAQTQVMAGVASSVRLQFTPALLTMEGWARRKFRAYEDNLARSEQRWILRDAGLRSVLNQEEMRDAGRALHSTMFWFEIQVAAASAEHANRIASALIARRGENRLQRRRMVARVSLYRQRFADAYPPLLPTFGFGRLNALATAAEVAHLLTLPTARMKAVPVRRLTIPRLPPPPEVARAIDRPVATATSDPAESAPSTDTHSIADDPPSPSDERASTMASAPSEP